MKYFLYIILLTSSFLFSQYNNEFPCKDALYLELKTKKIDSMTDREYEYFLIKDKQCHDYILSINNSKKKSVGQKKNNLDSHKTLNLLGFSSVYALTVLGDVMVDGYLVPQIAIPGVGPFLALIPSDKFYLEEGSEIPLIMSGLLQTYFLYNFFKISFQRNKKVSYIINPNPNNTYISLKYSF